MNFAWLLTVVLLPFAARLLTVHHPPLVVHAFCFGFYALLEVVSNVVIILMLQHAKNRRNIEADSKGNVSRLQRRCFSFLVGFGLSIPLFFLANYAWIMWIIGPIATHSLIRLRRHRQPLATP